MRFFANRPEHIRDVAVESGPYSIFINAPLEPMGLVNCTKA